MTPKMQEALDRLTFAGNLPKSAFHHSTVTALMKSGHIEEVPGDPSWVTMKVADVDQLPRRNPEVPVIPIDDGVIGSVRHVDVRPKAWIMTAAQTVANAKSWVCRSRVKPTRVSRRRAQRVAMAR